MVAANPERRCPSTGTDPPPALQEEAQETMDADGFCRIAQLAVRAGPGGSSFLWPPWERRPSHPVHPELKEATASVRPFTNSSVPHSNALYKA